MAETIGRVKSWMWWLAGGACALLFGLFRTSAQAEPPDRVVALYGVRPNPDARESAVAPEVRRKVESLVNRYLDPAAEIAVAPDNRAQINAAVARLDSPETAVVQEAKDALISLGPPALPALREKASGTTRGAMQAAEAAAQIKLAARKQIGEELRGIGAPATMIVQARMRTEAVARAEAAVRRAQALKDGDEESAEKALAEQKLAQKRQQYLTGLIRDLMADNTDKPIGPSESTKYGVRPIRPQVRYGIRTNQ